MGDEIGRVFIITRHQQGVAFRKGLHVGQLEGIGELRYQVGITPGNVQRIRVVGEGYQLEESRPVDLARRTELYFLVVLELLTNKDRREKTGRIRVVEMLAGVAQIARIP